MAASAVPYTRLPDSPTRSEALQALSTSINPRIVSSTDQEKIDTSGRGGRPSLVRLVSAAGRKGHATRKVPLPVFICVGLLLCYGIVSRAKQGPSTTHGSMSWRTQTTLQLDPRGNPIVDFESFPVPEEWSCNPFKQFGRMFVDVDEATNNYWKPYDEACPPSTMMKGLPLNMTTRGKDGTFGRHRKGPLRSHDTTIPAGRSSKNPIPGYEFLYNRTILLQGGFLFLSQPREKSVSLTTLLSNPTGDSMERLHLIDFCNFLGGNLSNIDPHHPASPPTYRKPMPTILGADGKETTASIEAKQARRAAEDMWDDRPNSWFYTRPWVCDLKEYNTTMINVFTWGMQDMEDAFQTEEFFHGPAMWLQRFHNITIPLLHNLAEYLNRPQILKPDFIELASGFWDLRGFTEQDFISRGIPRPYPMDTDLAFGSVGEDREKLWVLQMKEAVHTVARTFVGPNGNARDGPVISWRTLHHPKRNNYTPYSRAFAMDQLARKTLHEMRVKSLNTYPSAIETAKRSLIETTDRIFHNSHTEQTKGDSIDYGFDERIRVSEFGNLILGQEHHFKDFLHPDILPGSYLWCDMLLYE
ncbi:hypothetical protein T439DRAFT_238448 [Meredithblackwellia eburnea MCA 4105]